MNYSLVMIISCLVFVGDLFGQERFAAKLNFKVIDDDGKPVTGASISMHVFDHTQASDGFGRDVYKNEIISTGNDGKAILETATGRGEINYTVSRNGYYRNAGIALNSRNSSFGKWQPWDSLIEIKMQRVVDPIPLIARRVGSGAGQNGIALPVLGKPVGFDFEVSDWVEPFGVGKVADMIFRLEGATQNGAKPYEAELAITFSNAEDGLLPYALDVNYDGELKLPREAPEKGYQNKFAEKQARKSAANTLDGDVVQNGGGQNQNYFFRVRTRLDAQGNIIGANYGKIYGGIGWYVNGFVKFQYYFNPKVNDRNLEFDRKHNLFRVKKGEQVMQP